jgi:hypothetical protein
VGLGVFTDGAQTPTYWRGDVILDADGNSIGASNPLPTADGGAAITGAAIPAGGVGLTGWLSAIWSKLAGTLTVSAASLPLPAGAATAAKQDALLAAILADAQSAPFSGAVAMTLDVTYAARRSIGVLATVAGDVRMTLSDSSSLTLPVSPGWTTFPFAVTQIVSTGTTATASYFNLK